MYEVKSASSTHTGKVRDLNEDSLVESANLYAVADGMGGHLAGEVASSLALSVIQQYIEDNIGLLSGEKLVEKAIGAANSSVHKKALSSSRYRDMGTTVTLLYREGDTAYIGNVGDSRAYLFRGGELRQLTRDHSLVAKLVEDGEITPEEARRHPQRNVILKALGLEPQVEADVTAVKIEPQDVFLLATDGLTGMVEDRRIREVLSAQPEPARAVEELVNEALEAGGVDNVSVVEVAYELSSSFVPAAGDEEEGTEEKTAPQTTVRERRRKRGLKISVLIAVILLLLIGAGFGIGYYIYNRSYFVGDRDGKVVLFKGFPFWGLAQVEQETDIDVVLLSDSTQRKVKDNLEVESRENALETMESLREEAADHVLVPDVRGLEFEEAKAEIEKAGLLVEEPPVFVSSERARPDTVFDQDPDPFTRVGKGTGVKLEVVTTRQSGEA